MISHMAILQNSIICTKYLVVFKGWLKLQRTKPPAGYGFLPNGGASIKGMPSQNTYLICPVICPVRKAFGECSLDEKNHPWLQMMVINP